MAVGPGITEIPDSEDEPFTSSPDNTFSGAADKLCATPRGAVQDVQDTSQDVANPDQATTEHVGNDTDERTDNLDVDRDNASINDHAPVQTEGVLSQRSIINTNTPQEQRDLFLPQTQTAGLNANSEASLRPVADHAPFAGQQCTNAVMMDSGDQTDTILENQDMDVSSHSEHYESSGLLDDHVEQDRPETVVNQGSASTGIDQPKEPCPALSVSDAVEPLPVQSAFPAVGAATTDALPRTEDVWKSENTRGEEDYKSTLMPAGQSTNSTLQNFEVGTVSHMDTTGPIAATETTASRSSQRPDVQEEPTMAPGPVVESLVDESRSMDCTRLELEKPAVDVAEADISATEKSEIDPSSVSNPQPEALPSQQSPALTPQEITLAELKAQKASLLASLATLPAIRGLMEEQDSPDVDMSDNHGEPTEADVMAAVNKIVKNHIKLLHEYNELKDAGQGLMGLIADQRGVRIVEVQDEFGIDAND
jgi:hypothetical protein